MVNSHKSTSPFKTHYVYKLKTDIVALDFLGFNRLWSRCCLFWAEASGAEEKREYDLNGRLDLT